MDLCLGDMAKMNAGMSPNWAHVFVLKAHSTCIFWYVKEKGVWFW